MTNEKILIINICKEKLHYYEFVKPIENILSSNHFNFFTKNYKNIKETDLNKASHVIICGTSLFDNDFIKNINKFNWIMNFSKPILGICGGMQIIGMVFGCKLKKKTEIGYYYENFKDNFLGLEGSQNVYHLHNNYTDFNDLKDFEIFAGNEISQAVKHKKKEIYGVLFHPEVRQKNLIKRFCEP